MLEKLLLGVKLQIGKPQSRKLSPLAVDELVEGNGGRDMLELSATQPPLGQIDELKGNVALLEESKRLAGDLAFVRADDLDVHAPALFGEHSPFHARQQVDMARLPL